MKQKAPLPRSGMNLDMVTLNRNGEHAVAQIGSHDLLCTEFCDTFKFLANMISECNSMKQTYANIHNSLLSNNTSNVLQ